ncbi:hypothetical protein HOY80DRAFT_996659 [Tuber brumale]|nr:hypothetical protein HOY80DRAFT_996659 [Tuber brumale]
MNLEEFAKLFPDPATGAPLLKSTLSMILSNIQQHINIDLNTSDNQKKKALRQQFLILEGHISEWVYRAQLARVIATDDGILAIASKLVQVIEAQQTNEVSEEENYTGFEFSSGWLAGLKNRYGLGRVKAHGETVVDDPETYGIPEMKARLRERLKGFAPRDIYNCDELALQYNMRPDSTIARKNETIRGAKKNKTSVTMHLTNSEPG